MHPPRPFRGSQYDRDMFTFLPASSTDGLAESSRKRKLITYDRQVSLSDPTLSHNISGISGPKSNTGDLRDKEIQYSIPASPRRASSPYFKDSPRKRQYWDQKNDGTSWNFNKRNRHETRSEYTGYSSYRGQSQSLYHKDFSSLSAEQTRETSKWSASMTKDFNQFESHEATENKAKSIDACHFEEFRNCGPRKPAQMEFYGATNTRDQPPNYMGKSQTLPQVLETGAFAVNFHERDCQTRKASKWSPLKTDAVNHLGRQVSNTLIAREENASGFLEFQNSGTQNPEQVNVTACYSYDEESKNLSKSQSLQQSFLNQHSAVSFDKTGCQAQETSKWPPSVAEHCNTLESHELSRDLIASHFQEFQKCRPQANVQMMAVASSSLEHESRSIEGSQSLKKFFLNPGAFDIKSGNEETHKVESSSNVKGIGKTSGFIGPDNTNIVGSSECDIQDETNKLLQNALRLLSAASGIVSADNSDAKMQGQDDVRLMKLLLDSGIHNLKNSLVESAISKNNEASPNLDLFGLIGEKGSGELDNQCKYENKASALTEKLWDGILQLSSSVSVSAVAFFKSGERIQDLNWSKSVEVKGKVRLEAFEKYVQDLPRSRSRGLMVMSFCCKEGCSADVLEGMKEVAQKYIERKKVAFAQLSNVVDLYICPHSDAVITILAKHGFFKGMAAVIDKSDPLIGCVVWRKNPSLVPSSKTIDAQTPQSSEKIKSESSTVANKNQESISLSSVGEGTPQEEKCPELETKVELDKSNLQPPSVVIEHSAASSSCNDDEDDLPEYDFGAVVSQTLGSETSDVGAVDSGIASEKSRDDIPGSISAQMRSESSTISRTLPDFHFQGLVTRSLEHQSSPRSLSLPLDPQKQTRECAESSKPPDGHFQGPFIQNRGHLIESESSSFPAIQKEIGKCGSNSKPSTLFDDDDDNDIPEWCPPGFAKPGPKVAQGAGPSFDFTHSEVSTSKFAHSPSRSLPPPPPSQLQLRNNEYPSAPHLPKSLASNPSADDFMHKGPNFARSPSSMPRFDRNALPSVDSPVHKGSDFARNPSSRPRFDPLASDGLIHKCPDFAQNAASRPCPDFAQNPASRPRFDPKSSPSGNGFMHKGSDFARDPSSRPRFGPLASDGLINNCPDFAQNAASRPCPDFSQNPASRPRFDPKASPSGNSFMHKGSDMHKGPDFARNPSTRPRFDPLASDGLINNCPDFAQNAASRPCPDFAQNPASRPRFDPKASPSGNSFMHKGSDFARSPRSRFDPKASHADHKGPHFARNPSTRPRFDPKASPSADDFKRRGPDFARGPAPRPRFDPKGKPVPWRGSRP